MKTFIVKHALNINTKELDIEMIEDIIGNVEDRNEIYKGRTAFLNDPIDINKLMDHLQTLKNHGANYVAINYNIDKRGYEITGVKITIATQEEIDEHNREQKENEIQSIKIGLLKMDQQKKSLEDRLKQLNEEN